MKLSSRQELAITIIAGCKYHPTPVWKVLLREKIKSNTLTSLARIGLIKEVKGYGWTITPRVKSHRDGSWEIIADE